MTKDKKPPKPNSQNNEQDSFLAGLTDLEQKINDTNNEQVIDDVILSFNDLKDKLEGFLKHQQKTLLLFDSVFENAVDGLLTIDKKGKILQFNHASEKIFGYKREEVIGKNIKMLMPDPYQSEHDKYLSNYQKTNNKKVIGIGREVEGKKKDGTIFPIDLSVSEVFLEQETLYAGIVRDISERKRSEDEILRSNEELERFAYVASHDLQEPLRIVQSFSELLESEYKEKLDEQGGEYLHHILRSTERMQEMIRDLLEYSRVNSQAASLVDVDCNEKIDLALDNLAAAINETQAVITKDELPIIYGNPIHFSSLLQNLIGNALKYKEPETTPIIHIGVEDQGQNWIFSVKDNGIGIAPDNAEKIFNVFRRLHGKDNYKGTGVGLAICKKIVTAMKGKIWVESALGKGSTFFFSIPKS